MNKLAVLKHLLISVKQNKPNELISRKEKYIYDEMMINTISDSLARILANKHTGIVSIYLDTNKQANGTFRLNRVLYCSRQNDLNNRLAEEDVSNLIRYCFNQSVDRFIPDKLKRRLLANLVGTTNMRLYISDFEQKDAYFMQNVHESLLNSLSKLESLEDEHRIKFFHNILLIYFDLIILPIVFGDIFEPDQNVDDVQFLRIDNGSYENNQHPEATLASHVLNEGSQMQNRYIGASFLPCILCSELLDVFNFDYRGRSGTFSQRWEIPRILGEKGEKILEEHFKNVINNESNATKNRLIDRWPQTRDQYSDDICNILDYFQHRPKAYANTNVALHFLGENLRGLFAQLIRARQHLVTQLCGENCLRL